MFKSAKSGIRRIDRRSRESGNPGATISSLALDPRFRGGDGKHFGFAGSCSWLRPPHPIPSCRPRPGGGRVGRGGGTAPLAVDVRLIAAANADLPALAEAGRFRSDLLDRLAFDVVTVPPLRARADDIPLLAEHFARAMTRALGRDAFAGFSRTAMARLQGHSWPGNVRELKNAVERSLYRAANPGESLDEIILDPFASPFRPLPPAASPAPAPREPGDFRSRADRFEAEMLRAALAEHDFNQRRTALALGLGYHQLRHYLRKHAIAARRSEGRP